MNPNVIVFALEWLSRRAHTHFVPCWLKHTRHSVHSDKSLQSHVVEQRHPVCLWCVCERSRLVWGPVPTPTEHQLCERCFWWAQVYSHRWPQPAGQWALLLSQFIMCSRCPPWLQPWHHTNIPFTTWWHTAHTLAHWWHLEERDRAVHVRIKFIFAELWRGCSKKN